MKLSVNSLPSPMDRFNYLVDLRSRLIEEISGVQDAHGLLTWDDTRPNSTTRWHLRSLYFHARRGAAAFGLYIAERHGYCGSRTHGDDYIMEQVNDTPLMYADPRFHWRTPLDQGEFLCACPCSRSAKEKLHTVLHDVLFDKSSDQAFCSVLERVMGDIYEAYQRAGEKKPRSGIREYLLRALLTINDQILPQTVDDYIARRTAGA